MSDTDVDLTAFNPFDPAVQQCPHPHYAAMRAAQPVFRVPGTDLYLVTRHDLVGRILRDPATFSNRFGGPSGMPGSGELAERLREVSEQGYPQVSTLLTEDPPTHTAYRSTINAAFSPRRIRDLEPTIRAICDELLDRAVGAGTIELVRQVAVPLPVRAIARVLDVPDDRLDDFKRWSDDSTVAIGAIVDDDTRVNAQRGIVEFQHYFAAQIDDRRTNPRDDVLSVLVEATIPDGEGDGTRPLDVPEMLSIIQQLLVAGNETTTKMLTAGVRLLAEQPDVWSQLRDDPGRASAVTEEVLRLSSPTQGMFRLVTADTEIEGVPIAAGSMLVVMFAAANRDPAVFPEPDAFDPGRPNHKEHLAFGRGVHFCVGAPLARLEATIFFEMLARRAGSIVLDAGNTFEYEPSFVLRGLKRLDVELRPA